MGESSFKTGGKVSVGTELICLETGSKGMGDGESSLLASFSL